MLVAAGPVFRAATCLDFCLRPKGTRSTYVWEHVAAIPASLSLRVLFFHCFYFLSGPRILPGCPGLAASLSPFWFAVAQGKPGGVRLILARLWVCLLRSYLASGDRRVLAVLRPRAHRCDLAGALDFWSM